MAEFWEDNFNEKQEMWGMKPANSAIVTKDLFLAKGIKNILVPGFGYGRNAQVFQENGMAVTGIEISRRAIELYHKHFGDAMTVHHGSVTDMPVETGKYDGIYCFALIHLLNQKERKKLIRDCYNQLKSGGIMVFTAITKEAKTYGKGSPLGKDRFEIFDGLQLFFYDQESVKAEFDQAGLYEVLEIEEDQPMYLIKCQK